MAEPIAEGPGWSCLWPLGAMLGEGPVWVAREAALWFTDIEGRALHRLDPLSGERSSFAMPWRVGSIAPRAGGGFVAGTSSGFALIDPERGSFELLHHPEDGVAHNRFNDGKVDPSGAFWAGTMDDTKQTRQGALYRLAPDHSCGRADPGYRIANGPAFSADGGTMYHSDTLDRVTWAFDVGTDGAVSNKRVFAAWADGLGYPDGMTVDAEGYLWVAFWGGWSVRRVHPAGEIVAEHKLPVSNVTSMAFGGANFDRLFVTTARQALDAHAYSEQPLAGGLFEVFPGVRGLAGTEYAG